MKRVWTILTVLTMLLCLLVVPAYAAGGADAVPQTAAEVSSDADDENTVKTQKAWTAAILIGVACLGGALGMAHAITKATSHIAEQAEAAGQIRTSMMMGLVFIETVIIYALIVAILIIFVL